MLNSASNTNIQGLNNSGSSYIISTIDINESSVPDMLNSTSNSNIQGLNTSGSSYIISTTEINESYKSNIANSISNTNIPGSNNIRSSYITSATSTTEINESSIPNILNTTSNSNIHGLNNSGSSYISSTIEINESIKSNIENSTSKINIDTTNINQPSTKNITSTTEINDSNYTSIITNEHTVPKTDVIYNVTDTEKDTTNLIESSLTKINISNSTLNTIFTSTIPTINSQKTTLPSSISSIPNIKTTELIKVTIPSQINTTSIITNNQKIPTTNIYENTNTVQLILLAISNLEMSVSSFTFYIYFVQIENFIITYPTSLKFTIMVIYNTYLRSLEEKEAKCYLNNSNIGSKIQYICEVEAITSNIKQIKIEQKIYFDSSEKIFVIGSSPLFNLFKDNLQLIDKAYNQLLYKEIYILNNSTYYKYSKKEFNISGFIRDPQPKFKKNDLILMINTNVSTLNATCIINNLTSNDYTLYCKVNESLEYDLKYATSIIDNNSILVINLESGFESEIIVDSQNKSLHRSNANTTKRNNSSIIAIVISIFMFIAIVITVILIIYFKKKNKKTKQETLGVTESNIEHCTSFSKN